MEEEEKEENSNKKKMKKTTKKKKTKKRTLVSVPAAQHRVLQSSVSRAEQHRHRAAASHVASVTEVLFFLKHAVKVQLDSCFSTVAFFKWVLKTEANCSDSSFHLFSKRTLCSVKHH